MKLMFLGAPGAGKGTQAEVVSERYNIPAVSTGALLREAMANGTELGMKAKSYIDGGALVPDDVVEKTDLYPADPLHTALLYRMPRLSGAGGV